MKLLFTTLIWLGCANTALALPMMDGIATVAVSQSGRVQASGDIQARWRWASVTKQVLAVLLMQEVEAGNIQLEAPIGQYLPTFPHGKITVRQLLKHQSGLRNPDDEAGFYTPTYTGNRDPLTGYCAGAPKAEAGGAWAYNNCDYMVLGALLERVTGQTWPQLIHTRLVQHWGLRSVGVFPTPESTPESTQGGLENGQPEALLDLASFGASANVYGSAADLLRFDQILLNHGFLSPESRKTLWESRPEEGFIALGQWAYSVDLCGKSQRIIERRGAIGGVQVRNFLLPDTDTAVVFFAPEASLELGELWQGAGRSYEVLKAAVC